jgi:hypothetical protein
MRSLLEQPYSEFSRGIWDRSARRDHPSCDRGHSAIPLIDGILELDVAISDALRPLTDAEAFDRCTTKARHRTGRPLLEMLLAESDPLRAFILNGGEISPGGKSSPPEVKPSPVGAGQRPQMRPTFDEREEGGAKKTHAFLSREIGKSPGATSDAARSKAVAPRGVVAQDLLFEALKRFYVAYREELMTGVSPTPFEVIAPKLATAVSDGIPVAATLGTAEGEERRLVLFLQLQMSGEVRAYELMDVVSQEVVWINEKDLTTGLDNHFSDKRNGRVLRFILPG